MGTIVRMSIRLLCQKIVRLKLAGKKKIATINLIAGRNATLNLAVKKIIFEILRGKRTETL